MQRRVECRLGSDYLLSNCYAARHGRVMTVGKCDAMSLMNRSRTVGFLLWVVCGCMLGAGLQAQDAKAKELLESMVGEWEGDYKIWLRPGVAPDESTVVGEIAKIPGTSVFRHTYKGSFRKKPRTGEEILAYNGPEGEFQVSWVDTFHMNYAILFSTGKMNEAGNGFVVSSKYRMHPKQKYWGWRTEFEVKDADTVLITAYNITPQGQEGKASELIYRRVKEEQ